MPSTDYRFGVWLIDAGKWAVLPDRMKKPTWHNTDAVAAENHAHTLQIAGVKCEVREIPKEQLKSMRAEFAGVYR